MQSDSRGARHAPKGMSSSRRWSAVLVLVALLNAGCYLLIALGLRDAPHLTTAALRALTAGVGLALPAALERRPLPRTMRAWLMLIGIGLGTTTLGFLGMFHAAPIVPPGLATVVSSAQPLVAALLARAFLRERITPAQGAGLLLGFLGIVVMSLPYLLSANPLRFARGIVYVVFAAAGVAMGNVLTKAVARYLDPLVAMSSQALLGAIPLALGAALLERGSAYGWTAASIATLLALGLLATALSNWLWFAALERLTLSHANAFNFLTPLAGWIAAVSFFGERFDAISLIGLALALAGVALVNGAGRARL